MQPICSFPDCGAPVRCIGLCKGHVNQFYAGKPLRPILRTIEARFWAKVQKTDTCWLWTGATISSGYGMFFIRKGQWILAHRWSWEQSHGPIPDGLELDHLCRTALCVNPDHLEPVTHRENSLRGVGACAVHARKTHCIHGHPLIESNLYKGKTHGRRCRACVQNRRRTVVLEDFPAVGPGGPMDRR